MNLSNEIAEIIMSMVEKDGSTEIRRNDLAQTIGCVPSQINYVISSRFTPEHGFIVESRRGGGGYIKITRMMFDSPSALMHTVNSVGNELDRFTCRAHVMNLASENVISEKAARMILAATDDNSLRALPASCRDSVRASIFKNILLAYGKDD